MNLDVYLKFLFLIFFVRKRDIEEISKDCIVMFIFRN